MCYFKVKLNISHILGMVGPIDMRQKGNALVGYWVNYMTSTFDLTFDLNLGFSKDKVEIAVSYELLV